MGLVVQPPAGGSSATVPSGTGFPHVTSGAQDGAARAVNLASSADATGTLPAANQAAQAMGGSVAGTTASATVSQVDGASGVLPVKAPEVDWSAAVGPGGTAAYSSVVSKCIAVSTSNTTPVVAYSPAFSTPHSYSVTYEVIGMNNTSSLSYKAKFSAGYFYVGAPTLMTGDSEAAQSVSTHGTTTGISATMSAGVLTITGASGWNFTVIAQIVGVY